MIFFFLLRGPTPLAVPRLTLHFSLKADRFRSEHKHFKIAGAGKYCRARVGYPPSEQGVSTTDNDHLLIFHRDTFHTVLKLSPDHFFSVFYCRMKLTKHHPKQINDFFLISRVTAEATKKHFAIKLLSATALQLCISCHRLIYIILCTAPCWSFILFLINPSFLLCLSTPLK